MHLLQGSVHTATAAAMPDHLLRALPVNSGTVSCLPAYIYIPANAKLSVSDDSSDTAQGAANDPQHA